VTTTGAGGVTGARGSQDGYIRTALTGTVNDLPRHDYRGRAPAWARRVLLASEFIHGKPPEDSPGRPRKMPDD